MKRSLVYGASLFLARLFSRLQGQNDLEVHQGEVLADLGDLAVYDAVLAGQVYPADCLNDVVACVAQQGGDNVPHLTST